MRRRHTVIIPRQRKRSSRRRGAGVKCFMAGWLIGCPCSLYNFLVSREAHCPCRTKGTHNQSNRSIPPLTSEEDYPKMTSIEFVGHAWANHLIIEREKALRTYPTRLRLGRPHKSCYVLSCVEVMLKDRITPLYFMVSKRTLSRSELHDYSIASVTSHLVSGKSRSVMCSRDFLSALFHKVQSRNVS